MEEIDDSDTAPPSEEENEEGQIDEDMIDVVDSN